MNERKVYKATFSCAKTGKARYVFIVLKYARRDEKKNHLFQYHIAKLILKIPLKKNIYKHNWYLVIYIKLYIYKSKCLVWSITNWDQTSYGCTNDF